VGDNICSTDESGCCSPAHVFHSAAQSPTHTAASQDFEDARSLDDETASTPLPLSVADVEPPVMAPAPPLVKSHHPLQAQDSFNEIRRVPEATAGVGLKRRPSRGSATAGGGGGQHSRSHSRSHSRRISDFSASSDMDLGLPPLEALLFAHHLHFHPEEEGMTPDENDLFPSTPLDEDQLQHADNQLKEQLGSVIINTVEVS
jgi:hypothetical protein